MSLTAILIALCWLLPPGRVKNRLLCVLGYRVHPSARLGVCLVVGVRRFEVGAQAVVGHGNVFRGLAGVRLGIDTIIGQLNWFSTAPTIEVADDGVAGWLQLADHAVVTNRHYVDCTGGLRMGEFVTFGGVRTTVLTHTVDLDSGRQTAAGITVGRNAFVSSNCAVLPGVTLGERTVLAPGSVTARGRSYAPRMLHGGVPAKPITEIDGKYFRRTRAWAGQ